MILHSLARALAAATFAAVARSQNCQHGLTANDVAADAGLDLTGKTALVTGGRSGLGYAITEALLRVGCKVVIASRDLSKNQQAVQSLKSDVSGADVSYMIFDLESFDSVRAFAENFVDNHTRLDYYFGNAGQAAYGVQPLTVDGYERIFQVNYVSQVLLLDLLLPLMRQSQPSRAILTASSAHSLACGSLSLAPEDQCWGHNDTIAKLPFDQAGLDAFGNSFKCMLSGTYPLTKFLMTQLAHEVAKREADLGYQVHSFSWAPGNINTDLNPVARCCVEPVDDMPPCRFQLPYVGPTDEDGNPNPPDPPVHNHWSLPAHGAMAAVYTALVADSTKSGSFYATYWECEAGKGYFPQGITPEGRAQIYELSQSWAGTTSSMTTPTTAVLGMTADPTTATAAVPGMTADPTATPTSTTAVPGTTAAPTATTTNPTATSDASLSKFMSALYFVLTNTVVYHSMLIMLGSM